MMFRTLFRAAAVLTPMLVILAHLCLVASLSQRLRLEMEDRKEMAHAAHELGAISRRLTETADKFFRTTRTPTASLRRAQALLPVLMAQASLRAFSFAINLADYPAPEREPPTCAGWRGWASGIPICSCSVVYPREGTFTSPVSPEATIFDDVAMGRRVQIPLHRRRKRRR